MRQQRAEFLGFWRLRRPSATCNTCLNRPPKAEVEGSNPFGSARFPRNASPPGSPRRGARRQPPRRAGFVAFERAEVVEHTRAPRILLAEGRHPHGEGALEERPRLVEPALSCSAAARLLRLAATAGCSAPSAASRTASAPKLHQETRQSAGRARICSSRPGESRRIASPRDGDRG
jgi:hypothetical protein